MIRRKKGESKADFCKRRDAVYSRRMYHKRKMATLSLQQQVEDWQGRNAALRQQATRLEQLLLQAQKCVEEWTNGQTAALTGNGNDTSFGNARDIVVATPPAMPTTATTTDMQTTSLEDHESFLLDVFPSTNHQTASPQIMTLSTVEPEPQPPIVPVVTMTRPGTCHRPIVIECNSPTLPPFSNGEAALVDPGEEEMDEALDFLATQWVEDI